jgi:hypothetical protein
MSKSLNNNPVFKWEVTIGKEVFELSDSAFEKLMNLEKEGKKLVKVGDKVFNPAFISSAKKVYKTEIKPASDFLDWATMNKPEVNEPKALANKEKIKEDVRAMLKAKNRDWKPTVYKDPIHKLASEDVWEHLKSLLKTIEFPVIDETWKDDSSIIKHTEGRETHYVEYKTKIIDLGDKYDNNFWCEANFIFCSACNKHIRKQIVMFNGYESDCITKNLL